MRNDVATVTGVVSANVNRLAGHLGANPWMIGVLLVFIAYQLYRIALNQTTGLIALTLFDAIIVALTWREYRQQRRIRAAPATTSPTSAAQSGSGPT